MQTNAEIGLPGGSEHRAFLRSLFDAAVSAVHPASVLPGFLPPPLPGRVVIFAAGKAGGSLAAAAEQHYISRYGLDRRRLCGIAVARHGYGANTRFLEMLESGHPVPDLAGVAATERVLRLAADLREDDLALALISGGGSANWIAPAGKLTLAEKQTLTKQLLRCGADISEINAVRKHLSRIKGGRLALLAAKSRLLTLAISDVPGDDLSTIASGPTVPDPTTLADARAVLAKYDIAPGAEITRMLFDDANETPKPGNAAFASSAFQIIARPRDALAAAEREAARRGLKVISLGADVTGEAREVAQVHAADARQAKAAGQPAIILSGGELTVTIKGDGRGGPNQEYALALAVALRGETGISALAGDTDGTDGGVGNPSDPAGAVIDETTLSRAKSAGLDPQACLAQNDSTGFFSRLNDLLQTGPTLTNANDLRAILVVPR